jgi:hypothetical protein
MPVFLFILQLEIQRKTLRKRATFDRHKSEFDLLENTI